MTILDIFYLVFQSIRSRKARTLYTTLGVAIGIGAILFLVSLGYGLQKVLLERITTEESLLTLDITSSETRIIILDDRTLKKISEIPNVEKVSPQAVFPGQISFQELTAETVINLVDSDFFTLAGISPRTGRFFEEGEKRKIVVNSLIPELFNLTKEQILGKKLKILIFVSKEEVEELLTEVFDPKTEYEVVGVIEETEATIGNLFLNRKDSGLPIRVYQFAKVKVKDNKTLENVRDKLIDMGFLVSALSDTISQANKIFMAIQIILAIFGVVGLIVAAIGLINTMSITLLERTSEIGIMRSLGASASDIRRLFLIESTVCGLFGGIFGIGLGFGFGELINLGINILAKTVGGQSVNIFYYPFWFIIFIILLSTFVGFIAGFWPAKRAASLNPLQALRYK